MLFQHETSVYTLFYVTTNLYNYIISSPEPKAHRRAYSIPMVCRPPSTMLEHLLRNHLADQSQILCGASLGRGNEILFAACGSHDQDGHHAHIWYKPFKNLLRNWRTDFHETWYVASGLQPIIVCSNDDPGLTLTYFSARSNFVTWAFP